MTPLRGNTFLFRSSQQLPRLCLGPFKGFFELTQHPSRALDSPRALPPELNRKKAYCQVCRARGGDPTISSRTTDTNLDFVFDDNVLVLVVPNI